MSREAARAGRGLARGWAWRASPAASTPPRPQARLRRLLPSEGLGRDASGRSTSLWAFSFGGTLGFCSPPRSWVERLHQQLNRPQRPLGRTGAPCPNRPPKTIKCALACSSVDGQQGRGQAGGEWSVEGRLGGWGRVSSPHPRGRCTQLPTTSNPHPTSTWSKV